MHVAVLFCIFRLDSVLRQMSKASPSLSDSAPPVRDTLRQWTLSYETPATSSTGCLFSEVLQNKKQTVL